MMETKVTLEEKTIDQLQKLTRINLDSEEAFGQIAETTDDKLVAAYFREVGSQRAKQGSELQTLIAKNGEDAPESGSVLGAAHRFWLDLRTTLGGGLQVILNEAERGEDHILHAYEDALKENPGSAVSDVLHQHVTDVKAAHDRIRDMRDNCKE